jgi:hypothetical protein
MSKIFAALALALLAHPAHAAMTPMKIAEKSSYRLTAMVKKGEVAKSLSTHLARVEIETRPDGYQVTLSSPSASPEASNTVTVHFDLQGQVLGQNVNFVSETTAAPAFTQPDGAKLLDLAAEEVVDHLSEEPALPQVAEQTQFILVSRVSTAEGDAAQFDAHLRDGQVYRILLALNGDLLSKGFVATQR